MTLVRILNPRFLSNPLVNRDSQREVRVDWFNGTGVGITTLLCFSVTKRLPFSLQFSGRVLLDLCQNRIKISVRDSNNYFDNHQK